MHVATPICYVATTLFCMQHIFLSRPSFSGRNITFLPLAVFVSRPLFLVTTGLFCVQLISVSRPKDLYRESKHLLSLKFVATLTLLVATRSVHPLSTLYRDLNFFSSIFSVSTIHVTEVSVATEEGSIVIDILPSVQHYIATQTILFPAD